MEESCREFCDVRPFLGAECGVQASQAEEERVGFGLHRMRDNGVCDVPREVARHLCTMQAFIDSIMPCPADEHERCGAHVNRQSCADDSHLDFQGKRHDNGRTKDGS